MSTSEISWFSDKRSLEQKEEDRRNAQITITAFNSVFEEIYPGSYPDLCRPTFWQRITGRG